MSTAGPETRRSVEGRDKNELYDEDYGNKARRIFDVRLKDEGWRAIKGSGMVNWRFTYKTNEVKGEPGIHHAEDDGGLGKMIEKYGLDHAPEDPKHRYVALPVKDRKKLAQIYAELFPVTEIAEDKRKKAEELSHASNLEHGAKRKKKNPPPVVTAPITATTATTFPRVSMSPPSGGGNAVLDLTDSPQVVRVGTGRSYEEAAGSSPNASGGYSPDKAAAADHSPDAAPATATISYTTPVFDKDAFQDGVNKCDLDLMLKKVKLDGMRMQTEKNIIDSIVSQINVMRANENVYVSCYGQQQFDAQIVCLVGKLPGLNRNDNKSSTQPTQSTDVGVISTLKSPEVDNDE